MTPDLAPIPYDGTTKPAQKIVDYVRWSIQRQRETAILNCPRCNPTARAMEISQARWVVAGIDGRDE